MDQLANKAEQDVKKRRFRIGIILIVVGLLGMLMTAIMGPPQEEPTHPSTSAVSEPTESAQ